MKKMSSVFGIILFAATAAYAQDPKPATPPALTDAQKMEFFKAQAEFQIAASAAKDAEQTVQNKQTALQGRINVLTSACGKDFAPSMDAQGYPVCVANPKVEVKK